MGGLVAFEMARQLRRRGERVAALALIDVAAPGSPSSAEIEEVSKRSDRVVALNILRGNSQLFLVMR